MRIYIPATLPLLEQWLAASEATPAGGEAFAVTGALREWYADADIDELLEYAATLDAAVGALRLLAADADASRRRVVVPADVADGDVTPASSRGRAVVTLASPVAVKRWASVLVDDAEAADAVAAAVGALAAADRGDDDAQFTLDEAAAHELGWYGVQEARHFFEG